MMYNVDDNVIEIELNNKEIGELIIKLEQLREGKTHIHFDFNDEKHLLIHHEEDELK